MQLALPIKLDDSATFDNFYVPEDSSAGAALSSLIDDGHRGLYIWGGQGAGITHLLQACCRRAEKQKRSAMYVPLGEFSNMPPESVLADLERLELLCLDDVDAVSENPVWSDQLFHLYNRISDSACKLVVGAKVSAMQLDTPLADLHSRLSSMLTHQITKLDDHNIVAALIYRAERRGLKMPQKVADYLIRHYSRQLVDQFGILDRLDEASLAESKKLTVPFVKSVLNS